MENIQTEIQMMPGEIKTMMIIAKKQWNDTHIIMRKSESYNFKSSGLWKDLDIVRDANGYKSLEADSRIQKILMQSTEWLRRLPTSDWFKLIGSINHNKKTFFEIGSEATIDIKEEGLFSCFANDLSFMYGNNSGEIELTIKRLV